MTRSDRVYLRIDPDLKKRVQAYVDKRHTTISDIVTTFLVKLLEKEKQAEETPDAEQI